MDQFDATRLIQAILSPVVMITACALLINGMLGRYAAINDRLRLMAHERFELLQREKANLRDAFMPEDPYVAERLDELDTQMPELLMRHDLIHRALIATYLAILVLVLCMAVLAGTAFDRSGVFARVALVVFLLGTLSMLVGVLLIALEVRVSQDAISYEARRVLGLGRARKLE